MKSILYVVMGILIGLIMTGLLLLTGRAPAGSPVELMPSSTPSPIVVYVTGAVNRPGVYRLPLESRLVDAVLQAGGFTESAEISQVNLADKVNDGDQIVIPGAAEVATPVLTIGGNGILVTPTPVAGDPVNLNTATLEQLDSLPGIGLTAAKAIISYRTDNGSFTRVDDLLKVPGIGPDTLDQIRSLVTVLP
jgi:competence protein ComEA